MVGACGSSRSACPGPTPALQEVAALLGSGPRDYKTFAVDRDSGEVLSMKIRELAGAE
jgi:hypothetical protein